MEVTEPGQVLARKNGELVKKQRVFFLISTFCSFYFKHIITMETRFT